MTHSRHSRLVRTGTAAVALLTLATGCPSAPSRPTSPGPTGELRLVAFDSCADAVRELRAAVRTRVGPVGFESTVTADNAMAGDVARAGVPGPAAPADAGQPAGAGEIAGAGKSANGPTGYSGTNNHEAGVDEPDLVKTDGRRIVTVRAGTLRVIDPVNRRVSGTLDLRPAAGTPYWADANLLLHGDRALVLVPVAAQTVLPPVAPGVGRPGAAPPSAGGGAPPSAGGPLPPVADGANLSPGGGTGTGLTVEPDPMNPADPPAGKLAEPAPGYPGAVGNAQLLLVDLAGSLRVIARYRIDGHLVDARQTGGTARVVVRSAPRIAFPDRPDLPEPQRIAANQAVIDQAPVDSWLPGYEVSDGAGTRTARVGCDRMHHAVTYSGTSMLTILSFDLAASGLGDGDPVTVVADGDTVYGTDRHLYVAGTRWRPGPNPPGQPAGDQPKPGQPTGDQPSAEVTEIYQFDIGSGHPRYRAATAVPGRLLNQYALSEWAGHLRVATTSGAVAGAGRPGAESVADMSSSAVYVLRADGSGLTEVGRVTGLGRGERIFGVRFVGDTGYVVTFRQTDPLYSVDLRNPAAPRVTGELKITGYSAYLHPVGPGRLLGIGQEATVEGRLRGTQLSLFDVSDPAKPVRLARHHLAGSESSAEFDPHAFLYWAPTGTVVVPVVRYSDARTNRPIAPDVTALVLRVTGSDITEVGRVDHRTGSGTSGSMAGAIQRSLIIDGTLWTFSPVAVRATELATLRTLATLPA